MCDVIFTFGQAGSHFFQCPSRRDYFLITWRDQSGGDHIDSHGLPPELDAFLYATTPDNILLRNIPRLRLTLGPYNDSFFAHDSSAYQWMNLPPSLLSALQARITGSAWHDKPRIVALGADDNFILITSANAAVWTLSNYRTMNTMLDFSHTRPRDMQEIHHITLHAHRYQCFITQSSNGSLIFDNLPPHEIEGMQSMMAPMVRDTKEEEERKKKKKRIEAAGSRRTSVGSRQEMLRRDWNEKKQQFKMEAKGLRLTLRMGISAGGGGIKRMLGTG
ncbi:hypothetical protein K504DRAFT_473522 [Pleomassaria siparia CBS 279.74]|uniref:Uncharacterized protein n=1 Tax=Pleomassaria siparia CBS 279.74 TaxID=1314801 RepID=A0A6G1JUY2_9PLEO|nr:hypothetical protein K504DRAFT_473522 [Pleomassaria siparia CBS 279.74]